MRLSVPQEINPQFENTLLVSFPQIGSSEEYDGGYRSDHIANVRGIRVATVNRPIPKRSIIDLGGRDIKRETDNYITLVRRTGDAALQRAADELNFMPEIIYSGNSIGATAAIIMAEADPTETTTGLIALEPVGQEDVKHSTGMQRYFKQFKIDSEKPAEQLETESMEMLPFRTPAMKLVPRMVHEFWGHWDIGNTPVSQRLLKQIFLGSKAIDAVVRLAERSPIASPEEQDHFLRTLQPYAYVYHSRTGAYADISLAPGTSHSSMDKPLYFVRALDAIMAHRGQ